MTVADLLTELRKLDVHVVLDGDQLRLNAPAGVLTDEHKRDLAQRKPEIIAFLREAQQLAAQQRGVPPTFRTADQIGFDPERLMGIGWEIHEIQA